MKYRLRQSVKEMTPGVMCANTKFKRLRTILKNSVEIGIQCGISINVMVFDPRLNKLREHYTDKNVSLANV